MPVKYKTKGENIMENQNKYLLLARRAREEDNAEDARKYYDMVRTEDPDNVEAKFFYSYYRMFSDTQGHAFSNFVNFCKGIKSTVAMVIGSADSEAEKKAFLLTIINCLKVAYDSAISANNNIGGSNGREIVSTYHAANTEMYPAILAKYGNDTDFLLAYYEFKVFEIERINYMHSHMLKYELGDEIESKYSSEPKLMAFALEMWKDIIAKQQYAWGTPQAQECPGYPEKYAEKIKKYDPDYQMPAVTRSQVGCIQFGKK